jgi:hypothetical protein
VSTTPVNLITSGAYVGAELAAEFGELPPAFLPAGHRRLYTLGVEQLAALGGDIFISLPEEFDIPAWDAEQLQAAGVGVVRVAAGLSLGQSIRQALEALDVQGSVRILHGDTLFLHDLPNEWDLVSVSLTHFGYTWGYADPGGGFGAAPADKAPPEAPVLTGFFSFSDAERLIESLASAKGDFIGALNAYAEGRPMSHAEIQPWLDFGHLQPFYRSRSLITTQRSFNGLAVTPRYVEKWSEKSERMEAEIGWYEALPPPLRLYTPAYLGRAQRADGARAYRTAYEHAPTLHDLFVFGRLGERVWRRIFETCFEVLAAFAAHRPPTPINTLRRLTVDKTLSRLETWAEGQSPGVLDAEWRLDGEWVPSLRRIAEETAASVNLETDRFAALMHGDFGFPNIFYHFRSQRIAVIDPRGEVEPGSPSPFGDTRYDLAKLNHSLEGYDLILAGMHRLERLGGHDLSLSFPEEPGREAVRAAAAEFSIGGRRPGDRETTALTIHLFLSMLPLHADRPDRQIAFLANALRLFQKLERAS